MTVIGITGGIGSGKSIVCKIISLYGIPIYDADTEAKRLNDKSPVIKQKLIERFGENIYVDNILDRKQLANYIFNNKSDLEYVNNAIHTELAIHFQEWVNKMNQYPILALDAAVLFESGFDKYVDMSITVVSPIELRIARVSKRDNASYNQIKSRIDSQMTDEERTKLSDFVIINDEEHSLIMQTDKIIKNIENPLQN